MFTLQSRENPLDLLVAHAGSGLVKRQIDASERNRKNKIIMDTLSQIGENSSPLDAFSKIYSSDLEDSDKDKLAQSYNITQQYRMANEKEKRKLQETAQKEEQQKIQQQRSAPILAKAASGEELTPQELAELDPVNQRAYLSAQAQRNKKTYEPEEEKLEAQRQSKLADDIRKDYDSAIASERRLDRMSQLVQKGDLTLPIVVKGLNFLGLPLAVLNNPDTEEYSKLENDFIRDVSKYFPGQVRVYEAQTFLKTIPGLLNSDSGKKVVIKALQAIDKAKKSRYEAYKEILKENGGRKPRNLDILLDERTREKNSQYQNEFEDAVTSESIEKFQTNYSMIGPDGESYDIPANQIQKAVESGFKFSR